MVSDPVGESFARRLVRSLGEILLADVFEQIARECIVDAAVGDCGKIADRADDWLDRALQMAFEAGPEIERDTPCGDDVVDEVAIAAAEVEHGIRRPDAMTEIVTPERFPDGSAPRVESKACVVVTLDHASLFHPNSSPMIIRAPTVKPRQLLTLPPLLTPTR